MKAKARELAHLLTAEPSYQPISVPRNTATGVVTAFFAVVIGFAMIWRIYWLGGIGFVGIYAAFVVFAWRDRSEEEISAGGGGRVGCKKSFLGESAFGGRVLKIAV